MTERRRTSRTTINEIVYLELQPGTGGIILDASHDGLGFQAANRIRADEAIHPQSPAWSLRGSTVVGQLVWLDDTGKRGGLRFVDVPAETREDIQLWLAQSRTDLYPIEGPPPIDSPTHSARENPADFYHEAPHDTQRRETSNARHIAPEDIRTSPFAEEAAPSICATKQSRNEALNIPQISQDFHPDPNHPPSRLDDQPNAISVTPLDARPATRENIELPTSLAFPEQASTQPSSQDPFWIFSSSSVTATPSRPDLVAADKPRRGLFAVLSAAVCLFALAGISIHFFHSHKVNDLINNLRNRVASEIATEPLASDIQPASPADTEHAPSNSPNAIAEPGEPSLSNLPGTASESTELTPRRQGRKGRPAPTSRQPSPVLAAQVGGEAELDHARRYLRDASKAQRSAAVLLLWTAVGKGNIDAEIELAELYAHGDVLRKNCQQARILLKAAQARDNAVADRKLGQLPNSGCR
jgi:hypothetical protein